MHLWPESHLKICFQFQPKSKCFHLGQIHLSKPRPGGWWVHFDSNNSKCTCNRLLSPEPDNRKKPYVLAGSLFYFFIYYMYGIEFHPIETTFFIFNQKISTHLTSLSWKNPLLQVLVSCSGLEWNWRRSELYKQSHVWKVYFSLWPQCCSWCFFSPLQVKYEFYL